MIIRTELGPLGGCKPTSRVHLFDGMFEAHRVYVRDKGTKWLTVCDWLRLTGLAVVYSFHTAGEQ